jgi:hypothetical protein
LPLLHESMLVLVRLGAAFSRAIDLVEIAGRT